MAQTFNVTATVVQADDGSSVVTIQLPELCADTPPVVEPPPPVLAPIPIGLMAISDDNGGAGPLTVRVSWQTVTQATGYLLERRLTVGPGSWASLNFAGIVPAFVDTAVVDTTSYDYRVSSINSAGTSAPSSIATVVAHATTPPPVITAMDLEAPKNLCVKPFATGTSTADDHLTWDTVTGAITYNVYREYVKIATITAPTNTYAVPNADHKSGACYRVSAVLNVSGMTMETRRSAPAEAQGPRPTFDGGAPGTPNGLTVSARWQGGDNPRPYNYLDWGGAGQNFGLCNVYRDSVLIAECLWTYHYVDEAIVAGASHTYQVSFVAWRPSGRQEGTLTSGVAVTALSGAPTSPGSITFGTHINNDDSTVIVIASAVSGARDYRAYPQGTQDYKYSGGGLKIECNGLTREVNTTIVVEALAEFGPHDQDENPKNHALPMHVNGHGDPWNQPVILRSGTTTAHPTKRIFTGTTPFLDCFDTAPTFISHSPVDQNVYNVMFAPFNNFYPNNASNPWLREQFAPNWIFRQYIADAINTKRFFGHTHEMEILYDGGAPGNEGGDPSPPHNNNATNVYICRLPFDIPAAPACIHITFEVDGFSNSRRWMGLGVMPENDSLTNPAIAKLNPNESPTWSGNCFTWEIYDLHRVELFVGTGSATGVRKPQANFGFQSNSLGAPLYGTVADRMGGPNAPGTSLPLNGDDTYIDLRSQYDLYLNRTGYKIVERGVVVQQKTLTDPLSWIRGQFWLSHHVYHTNNDRIDQIQNPGNQPHGVSKFWRDYRPFGEVRHWDNMGFRILPAIP